MTTAFQVGRSTAADTAQAIEEACQQAQHLERGAPDWTILLVTHAHRAAFGEIARRVRQRLGSRLLMGCTGEGLVANGQEYEETPALAVWNAWLPGATLTPFRLAFDRTPDGILCEGLPEGLAEQQAVFLLGEPFSSAPQSVIDRLAVDTAGVPLIGGMASGARSPGENALFFQDDCISEGAVGVALRDGPALRTVVSQGCRPIGPTYLVTKAERNLISELGRRPAVEVVQELYDSLPTAEQQLIEQGIFLGLAMNEYRDRFGAGDFLIANLMGVDQRTGAMVIGNLVRVGQTVQFHVRDARSADDDLKQMLARAQTPEAAAPAGGLVFTCNGRGTRLFGEPHHDAQAIQQAFPDLPVAGFFANGELGPVTGKNYVHGYTASVALFGSALPRPISIDTPATIVETGAKP